MDYFKGALLPVAAFAVTMGVNAQETDGGRPNVLLIYADDLGYGDLGCYGARNVSTPNVDALAQGGLRFTNAHSVASTSTPSRYALLTGQYPWRKKGTDVAAGDAAMIISPDQYTVADAFKAACYTTAAFGKWHLGLGDKTGAQDWNTVVSPALSDIGFDYSYIMAATADRVPCVFIENGHVANYDPAAPIEVSYSRNFEGEPTGRENPELLYNLKSSHGHDMAVVNGIGRIGYMKGGGTALWKDENIADSITARAVDFINKSNDTPFFIYFATNDVHVPRFPHERFRGATNMGMRGDAIAQFDWCVGQLVDALRRKGLLDNTVIILTSDNGPVVDDGYADRAEELLNGHDPMGGLRGGKYSCFEAGTRVPFIVHWPARIKRAAVKDGLVSQIDFASVMAVLANVILPEGAAPDANNLAVEYWFDAENGKQRPYVVQMAANHTLSLRLDGWKYIAPCNGPAMVPWGPKIETGYLSEPQLYRVSDGKTRTVDSECLSVQNDSQETENVAEKYPEIVEKMKNILNSFREK